MPQTPRLALPLIAAGQSQKDVTHNEALLALDRLVALEVVSRSLNAPPADPATGDIHVVPAGGVAGWGYPEASLVQWQGQGWLAESPREGQVALVRDEAVLMVYRGGWQVHLPVSGLSIMGRSVLGAPPASVAAPSGGTFVDSEVRAVLSNLLNVLREQGILAP
jgi:hypothetical protein